MTLPQKGAAGGHPSPLPVMTILLVSALLAALGIIVVKRSDVPALGWVFLGIAIIGVVFGVLLALKNVQLSRTIERRSRAVQTDVVDDDTEA